MELALAIVGISIVIFAVWFFIFYIPKHSKPLVKPRKPYWEDLAWYTLLIFFFNLIGLLIDIILWNKNHVKDGEWWGWWDKQKTVSSKKK